MAKVAGAVQVDRIQQWITGDGQRFPPAGQLVLVVVVDRGQAGGVQLAQGGRDGGRTDRAAASGGESGDELVEALRPCRTTQRSRSSLALVFETLVRWGPGTT